MRIAISGKSGCGNSTVTQLVAEKLGFRWVNYTFKNLARQEGVSPRRLALMAEENDKWDRILDQKQLSLAEGDGVVVGSRLAIWLIDAELKVYLDGLPRVRAKRIQKRNVAHKKLPQDYSAVLTHTIERDRRDHDRYLRLYSIDIDEYSFADLIIDTSVMTIDQEV